MKKLLLLSAFFLIGYTPLSAQPALALEEFATGLSSPVDITNAGDDRLFVVERSGRIKVVQPDGTVLSTPFLDIVSDVNDFQSEQGLLGLAFHPEYASNGYFYVNYITGSGAGETRVSRFTVNASDPNLADPDSELILMEIDQPYWNHNGGDLNFGPDGYLYIGLGDGGSANDPQNRAQNLNSYMGKILRIDVDNQEGGLNYAIPEDNPFVDPNDGALDEIWAYGLRNPWRFSFDQLTGDMWIGDVGQNEFEEIDFQPAGSTGGENYGWRCYEADEVFNAGQCDLNGDFVFPVFAYPHNSGSNGCSVTGGFVYRGCVYPELYGHYLLVDYCTGKFWSVFEETNGDFTVHTLIDGANFTFSSFGEDRFGELYLASLGDGRIFRVTEETTEQLPAFMLVNETCEGDGDGSIEVTWNGADPAAYNWSTGADTPIIQGLNAGSYALTLTVDPGCAYEYSFEIGNDTPDAPEVIQEAGPGVNELTVPDIYASYQWYLDGLPISGANSASYLAVSDGEYFVEVTSPTGCVVASNSLQVFIENVDEIQSIEHLYISPNPFQAAITIQLRLKESQQGQIQLLNVQGQVIATQQFDAQDIAIRFETGSLASGLYLIRLEVAEEVLVQKLMKTR